MFTKSDLKTGMFVKLRDERIGMIIEDNIIMNKGGFLRLTAYNESLCLVFPEKAPKFDIIEVREIGKYVYDFNMFDSMDVKYKESTFNKSDIQNGDIVITHYSNEVLAYDKECMYCKIGNVLVALTAAWGSLSLDDFTEDLRHNQFNETIIKVYRCNTPDDYNTLIHDTSSNHNLIYGRRE